MQAALGRAAFRGAWYLARRAHFFRHNPFGRNYRLLSGGRWLHRNRFPSGEHFTIGVVAGGIGKRIMAPKRPYGDMLVLSKKPRYSFGKTRVQKAGIGGVYEGGVGKQRRVRRSKADLKGSSICERFVSGQVQDGNAVYIGAAPFDLGAMYDAIGMAILRELARKGVSQEITDWNTPAFNVLGQGQSDALAIVFIKQNSQSTGGNSLPDVNTIGNQFVWTSYWVNSDTTNDPVPNTTTWEQVGHYIGIRLREYYDVTWNPAVNSVPYPALISNNYEQSIPWTFGVLPYAIALCYGSVAYDSTNNSASFSIKLVQHVMYFNQMKLWLDVRTRVTLQNNTTAQVPTATVGSNPTSAIELNNEPVFGKIYNLRGRAPITIDNIFPTMGFGAGKSVIAAGAADMPKDYTYLPQAGTFENCVSVANIGLNPGQSRSFFFNTRVSGPFHNMMMKLEPQAGLTLAAAGRSVLIGIVKRFLDDTNPILISYQIDRYYGCIVQERKKSFPVRYYRTAAPTVYD